MPQGKATLKTSAGELPSPAMTPDAKKTVPRKRISTLPLEKLAKTAKRQTNAPTGDEAGFPFFKLPPEVRNCIYRYAYGTHLNSSLRNGWRPNRVIEFAQSRGSPLQLPDQDGRTRVCFKDELFTEPWHQRNGNDINPRLLRTCKQVYIESLAILFENKVFGFREMADTSSILRQIGTNGQRYIQAMEQIVSSGHLGWWPTGPRCFSGSRGLSPLIKRCPHLKTITVYLFTSRRVVDTPVEDRHSVSTFRGLELRIFRCHNLLGVSETRFHTFCQELIDLVAQPRQ